MKLLFIFLLSTVTALAQTPEWSRKYHTGSVTCLDFSSDGTKLASGSKDGSLALWNVSIGDTEKVYTFAPSSWGINTPFSFAFADKDRQIVGVRYIAFVDNPTDKRPVTFSIDIENDKFLPGFNLNTQFLFGNSSVIELDYMFNSYSAVINDSLVLNGVFSTLNGASGWLNISGIGGIISLDNILSGQQEIIDNDAYYGKLAPGYSTITLSHDKTRFFGSGTRDIIKQGRGDYYSNLSIFTNIVTLADNSKVKFERIDGEVIQNAAFSGNDEKIIVSRKNGEILEFATNGKYIRNLTNQTSVTLSLSSDLRNQFYISAHIDSTLRLWTPDIPNIFKKIQLESPVTTIAISPDSVRFATAHTDGTVAVWNIDSLAYYAQFDTVLTDIAEENPFKTFPLSTEPNPFKNSTTIHFSLPKSLKIKLAVTDILGKEIAVLKDEFMEMGEQSVVFKNENLPDGMYYITLSGEGLLKTIPVQITR